MNTQAFIETETRRETCTRSELVFATLVHVPNRYRLCQLTAKGARKLHKPNERMQDTVNEVLMIFDGSSTAVSVPSAPQLIPESSLHPVFQASHLPDATPLVLSQTTFMREERNYSHV